MKNSEERPPADLFRMGPIRVVEISTSAPPADSLVTESLGNETVPFDQVRHLCSGKPLRRLDPGTLSR